MTLDRPYSILVTDDDPASRETFRAFSEAVGFKAFLAGSGEQAIEIVHQTAVHLALMDRHLPKLAGLETMAIVRQIKGMLPMSLISADQDEGLMRRALSAQAYSVLSKPVSRNLVIYVVRRALEKFY